MSFLYGNHVLKSGLGRITDNTPAYAGVVVCSMADVPLGFATTAKSTLDCRKLDPSGIVAFHQADTGEYLRKEDEMIGAAAQRSVARAGRRPAALAAGDRALTRRFAPQAARPTEHDALLYETASRRRSARRRTL
jgi:hypothetical protein